MDRWMEEWINKGGATAAIRVGDEIDIDKPIDPLYISPSISIYLYLSLSI